MSTLRALLTGAACGAGPHTPIHRRGHPLCFGAVAMNPPYGPPPGVRWQSTAGAGGPPAGGMASAAGDAIAVSAAGSGSPTIGGTSTWSWATTAANNAPGRDFSLRGASSLARSQSSGGAGTGSMSSGPTTQPEGHNGVSLGKSEMEKFAKLGKDILESLHDGTTTGNSPAEDKTNKIPRALSSVAFGFAFGTAAVTGARRGLGRALANNLVDEGIAQRIVNVSRGDQYVVPPAACGPSGGGGGTSPPAARAGGEDFFPLDFEQATLADIKRVVDALPDDLDLVIHNASPYSEGNFMTTDTVPDFGSYGKWLRNNLWFTQLVMKKFIARNEKEKSAVGGRLLFVGSVAGRPAGAEDTKVKNLYGFYKSTLVQLSEIANNLGLEHGIRSQVAVLGAITEEDGPRGDLSHEVAAKRILHEILLDGALLETHQNQHSGEGLGASSTPSTAVVPTQASLVQEIFGVADRERDAAKGGCAWNFDYERYTARSFHPPESGAGADSVETRTIEEGALHPEEDVEMTPTSTSSCCGAPAPPPKPESEGGRKFLAPAASTASVSANRKTPDEVEMTMSMGGTAVVTSAAGGLGKYLAEKLTDAGLFASVIGTSRAKADRPRPDFELDFDVMSAAQIQTFVEERVPNDVELLIHNASPYTEVGFLEDEDGKVLSQYASWMEKNLAFVQAVAKKMESNPNEATGKKIVLIGSIAGRPGHVFDSYGFYKGSMFALADMVRASTRKTVTAQTAVLGWLDAENDLPQEVAAERILEGMVAPPHRRGDAAGAAAATDSSKDGADHLRRLASAHTVEILGSQDEATLPRYPLTVAESPKMKEEWEKLLVKTRDALAGSLVGAGSGQGPEGESAAADESKL